LDVGGGAGYLSVAITEAFPELKATMVDLPTATPLARRVVAEMGAEIRVQVVTADVVNDPITGNFDVAVLRHLIQVLSAEQARSAIINAVQAVNPGGTV